MTRLPDQFFIPTPVTQKGFFPTPAEKDRGAYHQLNNHLLKVHIPISDLLPVLRCIHNHLQSQHQ